MRTVWLCRVGPAIGFAALAIFAGTPQASAQERPKKIEIVPNIPHSEGVTSVAFSPDGTRVLSGSQDSTLKLWDAASGQLIRTFEGHTESVLSVEFSPDGTRLLSHSQDGTHKLWDAATGQAIRTLKSRPLFSPDGTQLLSVVRRRSSFSNEPFWDDQFWELRDAASGQLIHTFETPSVGNISVAFSPDGARLLLGSYDRLSSCGM
jgi:WD40 repeat protein